MPLIVQFRVMGISASGSQVQLKDRTTTTTTKPLEATTTLPGKKSWEEVAGAEAQGRPAFGGAQVLTVKR